MNLKSEIERLRDEKTAIKKENAGLKAIEKELKKENAGLKAQVKQLQDENLCLKRESQLSRPPLKELRKVNRAHEILIHALIIVLHPFRIVNNMVPRVYK